MNEFMGAQRFDKALDDILPAWRHKAGQRHAWTTPRGAFWVEVKADKPGRPVAAFSGESWNVTVPTTVAGLDALVVVMVLAGAIGAPERGHVLGIEVKAPWVSATGPGCAHAHTPAEAFATGLAFIEAAGHMAGWRA